MHFVIDADSIAYRAAASAEGRKYILYFHDQILEFKYKKEVDEYIELNRMHGTATIEFIRDPEPVGNAIHNLKALCDKILEHPKCSSVEFHLSGSLSFRKYVATSRVYKGNRDPNDKPHHLEACRSYLVSNYGATVHDWIEADDAVSIAAIQTPSSYETVIVSIDKDLNNTPGWHYNWLSYNMYHVTEIDAYRNFYKQLLTGDTTDNIGGISGIGPVTANKILAPLTTHDEMLRAVREEYLAEYGPGYETFLTENGRLLWMMRHMNDVWSPIWKDHVE